MALDKVFGGVVYGPRPKRWWLRPWQVRYWRRTVIYYRWPKRWWQRPWLRHPDAVMEISWDSSGVFRFGEEDQ